MRTRAMAKGMLYSFSRALIMPEIVLSAFARNAFIIDGMDGTVVIAPETTGAVTAVLPEGNVGKHNIAYRTFLGATPTVNTCIHIDGELPVRNHEAVEVGANDMAECPGCQP